MRPHKTISPQSKRRTKTGSHPGVLIWPDAFGLRPAVRDLAKRLAAAGYSVLVPNPFYRVQSPRFTTPAIQLP